MDVSKLGPFPDDLQPKVDQAYFDKLREEMKVVRAKMDEVDEQLKKQPSTEEIWCTVGDTKYGHPITPLLLRLRALMWHYLNPPDPRGEPMYSRVGPYTVFVRRTDLVEVLPYEMSTIDRMLAEVREKFEIEPYKKITVKLFCYAHGIPEPEFQQQLDDLFKRRFKK